MSHNSRANPHTETISAGELAEMGLCEKKIHLRQLLGPRQVCPQRKVARLEGVVAHAAMHAASTKESKRQCFIATSIYGVDAPETDCLRSFRDTHLNPHWWGKCLVTLYYRVSPMIVRVIKRNPLVRRYVTTSLDHLIRCLSRPSNVN